VTGNRVFAWGVHFYTALGAVFGFLMVTSTVTRDYRQAFLWMAAATLVDATDGVFARLARVKEVTPGFDGGRLDDIVDYVTFVFAPAFLLEHAGVASGVAGRVAIGAVLVSSAYGFSRVDAKTADHFFTGFPSYWNIVAFYLFAATLPSGVNAAILLALAAMVFVPIKYVYPSRTPVLRTATIALGIVWGAILLFQILRLPDVSMTWLAASLFYPAYYLVLSLALQRRRHEPPRLENARVFR
jgi:phosphatidylcholine synthase